MTELQFDHTNPVIAEAMKVDVEAYTAKILKMEKDLKLSTEDNKVPITATEKFEYIHKNFELNEIFFMLFLVEDRYYQLMDIIGLANHIYHSRQLSAPGIGFVKGGKPTTEA